MEHLSIEKYNELKKRAQNWLRFLGTDSDAFDEIVGEAFCNLVQMWNNRRAKHDRAIDHDWKKAVYTAAVNWHRQNKRMRILLPEIDPYVEKINDQKRQDYAQMLIEAIFPLLTETQILYLLYYLDHEGDIGKAAKDIGVQKQSFYQVMRRIQIKANNALLYYRNDASQSPAVQQRYLGKIGGWHYTFNCVEIVEYLDHPAFWDPREAEKSVAVQY